jgi:hypothetical protein
MKGFFLLILGLVLAAASPVSSQLASGLDDGGSPGDQVIRLGNRPADQLNLQADDSPGDDSVRNGGDDPADVGQGTREILTFGSMVGVSGPLVGTDVIRGVPAGGRPWNIARGEGRLMEDGAFRVSVEGLVLAESEVNPATSFRGLVSCLTGEGEIVNVLTGEFSADADGNAAIEDTVEIANPCLAPVVFVTSATCNWFAISGR